VLFNAATTNPTTELVFPFIEALRVEVRGKWIRFVRTHSANFNPSGIFVVCSNHFTDECFQRALHIEGFKRTIIPLSVPTIWKKDPEKTFSARARRQVGDLIKLGFFVILAGLRELWLKVSLLY